MEEFRLNEEQVGLAKKFFANVKDLIKKYSYMEVAFKLTINELTKKINVSDDENIKEVKEKTELLQRQIISLRSALERLKDINVYSDGGVPAYNDAFSFLIGVYDKMSNVIQELGTLEGCTLGNLDTQSDVYLLKADYNALMESLKP